jgi:hypothetical protein
MRYLISLTATAILGAMIAANAEAAEVEFVNDTKVACIWEGRDFEVTVDPKSKMTKEYNHQIGTRLTVTCKDGGYSNRDDLATCMHPGDALPFTSYSVYPWQFGSFSCSRK